MLIHLRLIIGNLRVCNTYLPLAVIEYCRWPPSEAHYIEISPRDEIFVADTLNWRVQKYVRK